MNAFCSFTVVLRAGVLAGLAEPRVADALVGRHTVTVNTSSLADWHTSLSVHVQLVTRVADTRVA